MSDERQEVYEAVRQDAEDIAALPHGREALEAILMLAVISGTLDPEQHKTLRAIFDLCLGEFYQHAAQQAVREVLL